MVRRQNLAATAPLIRQLMAAYAPVVESHDKQAGRRALPATNSRAAWRWWPD
jgi:hypothetical protein